ncbi:hypothetical protein BOVMAS28_11370 [Streptococcus uberis]
MRPTRFPYSYKGEYQDELVITGFRMLDKGSKDKNLKNEVSNETK